VVVEKPEILSSMQHLLTECRGYVSINETTSFSVNLRRQQLDIGITGVAPTVLPESIIQAPFFFRQHPTEWAKALTGSVHQATALLERMIDIDGSVVDVNGYASLATREQLGDAFEDSMQALGRAIGVVIRLGGQVASLRFPIHLVDQLQRNLPDSAFQLDSIESLESVYFVRKGLIDVLGPVGLNGYDRSQLLALFGHPNPSIL
jgi:hypothetical protein